uniref:Protein-lysine N-methyltransferase n=1 Tax=Chlamydomonas euryale TaxID=1486919 RepID=A0A7R9YZ19_9CHLO
MATVEQPANAFLSRTAEDGDLNQYWYSSHTIKKIAEEVAASATKAAFLSTPSVYFSLPADSPIKQASWVFDLDDQWSQDSNYFKYDFNKPDDIPKELHHVFDCVVIDPPFITREVWEKYAAAAKLLLSDSGKVIGTTVAENGAMLAEIIPGMAVTKFKPSIPNLIYQYNLFTTFPPKVLCEVNPEIPDDD